MIGSKFDSPEEIRRRKNFKKGIEFTLLVCGQQGLGKTSFINSLCKQVVSQKDTSHVDPRQSHLSPGMSVSRSHVNIAEADSTPIALDVVSAPGFGDNVNNKACADKIVDFLEEQFDKILSEECRIQRNSRFKDGRPHAALYFIRPTSRGLRELDIDTMKKLSTRVNVIPVIGKADSLTKDELKLNKSLILQDIRANDIRIFEFLSDEESDTESISEFAFLKELVPFAISGSYEVQEDDGKLYHIREYPWGTFRVEDIDHSDFTYLRSALFGSHLQELKDSTHNVLYENYRRNKLAEQNDYATNINTRADDDDAVTLYRFYGSENDAAFETDETLREILRKKKVIRSYKSKIKQLQQLLRVAQLGSGGEQAGNSANSSSIAPNSTAAPA